MAEDTTPATGDDQTTTDDQQQSQQNGNTDTAKTDLPPEVKAALRKANKEAESLRLKLKEFEDRDKTEAQKLADAKTAAEKAAADATQNYLRLKVGTTKGLAPDLAERLHGTTEDEMAADADRLLAVIGTKQPAKGSADGGARGTAPRGDMSTLIRQAAGRA